MTQIAHFGSWTAFHTCCQDFLKVSTSLLSTFTHRRINVYMVGSSLQRPSEYIWLLQKVTLLAGLLSKARHRGNQIKLCSQRCNNTAGVCSRFSACTSQAGGNAPSEKQTEQRALAETLLSFLASSIALSLRKVHACSIASALLYACCISAVRCFSHLKGLHRGFLCEHQSSSNPSENSS